jgi:arylsulfatase A-like enzyme
MKRLPALAWRSLLASRATLASRSILAWTLALIIGLPFAAAAPAPAPAPSKPNILFILCDDLGYGDIGIFYQNSRQGTGKPFFSTPHIDDLARGGLMMRQHYTAAPVCAPARASLMTGLTQGHCNIRNNEFDWAIAPGMTLGSMMKQADYDTVAIGKWGIGGMPAKNFPAAPTKRGFDEYFGFLQHAAGHVYYHDPNHKLFEATTDVTAQYEHIYSTDLFTARAKKYIVDHNANHPDRPFFMYLAYTAVHNALQVPANPYPQGFGLRGGVQWPLAPTPDTQDTWIHPDYANQTSWTDPMKRYATMARRLDDGVADIVELLRDLKLEANTLIIFTSDNGPANEGDAKDGKSDPRLFDSWGPFDGFKRDCFEGGMREPTIAYWPGHIPAHKIDDTPSAFWDWMPTFAEAAGLPQPAHSDGISLLHTLLRQGGQRQHPYLYFEYLFDEKNRQPAADDVARRKAPIRGQQQVIRIGDLVGIRTQIKSASDPLRLYNVINDPHQDHNLAGDPQYAPLLARMDDLLITSRRPNAQAKRPYDDALLPPIKLDHATPGELSCAIFDGQWPWVPNFETMAPAQSSETRGLKLPARNSPYGAEFTGYLTVPADGEYTFTLTTDGSADFWLHDAHMIDAEAGTSPQTITEKILLRAGAHPLRIFYTHKEGNPQLTLHYTGPGISDQEIPSSLYSTN